MEVWARLRPDSTTLCEKRFTADGEKAVRDNLNDFVSRLKAKSRYGIVWEIDLD